MADQQEEDFGQAIFSDKEDDENIEIEADNFSSQHSEEDEEFK